VMDHVTGTTRVGPPPPDEPPRGRRRWPLVVGALVLLLALAAAAVVLLGGDEAQAVTIPTVAGQPAAQAAAALTGLGLEVDQRTVQSADVEAGLAIGTTPPAGAEAREGDTVVLRVSGGPGRESVPDVVGDTRDAATQALRQAGFEVEVVTQASDDVRSGLVISQSPEGGEQAEVGSTVTITVSSGAEEVAVPDVRRQSINSATAELEGNGLALGRVSEEENGDFAPGTVLRQDPGPTVRVPRGTRVDVVVAAAVSQIQVPSGIIGNNASDARAKLEDSGFVVTSDEAPSDDPAGVVIAVTPSEGTSVARGSTVTITVSTGPDTSGDGDGGVDTTIVPAPPPSGEESDSNGRGPDGAGPPGQRR
jgi:eukaryotic-like serine/threonine-protein kinase